MRYENGWIFADGRFVRGGFSVENGRFAHVLEDVPGPAEDLDGALVIPGLVDIHVHGCAGCIVLGAGHHKGGTHTEAALVAVEVHFFTGRIQAVAAVGGLVIGRTVRIHAGIFGSTDPALCDRFSVCEGEKKELRVK